jgi:hypothetical protein
VASLSPTYHLRQGQYPQPRLPNAHFRRLHSAHVPSSQSSEAGEYARSELRGRAMANARSLVLVLGLVVLLSALLVAALPASNHSIIVPEYVTYDTKNGLLCTRARWYDVVVFFLVNYGAHAATVRKRPGERASHYFWAVVMATLVPFSGLLRGIEAMHRRANLKRNVTDLQLAARSGALCIVVRKRSWAPLEGERFDTSLVFYKHLTKTIQTLSDGVTYECIVCINLL